jgi:hypothetical protein
MIMVFKLLCNNKGAHTKIPNRIWNAFHKPDEF